MERDNCERPSSLFDELWYSIKSRHCSNVMINVEGFDETLDDKAVKFGGCSPWDRILAQIFDSIVGDWYLVISRFSTSVLGLLHKRFAEQL